MPVDPHTPTGVAAIRVAVAEMRDRAHTAANNADDDMLCCWQYEMIGGQQRVIQTRVSSQGEDSNVLVLPAEPGVARYIAGWHPGASLFMAALLETIGQEIENCPEEVVRRAVKVAQTFITEHRQDECDDDCEIWHHITEFPREEQPK